MTIVSLHTEVLHDQEFQASRLATSQRGDRSKIRADFVEKVERILARLDASAEPSDMDTPGFGLHAMTGDRRGFWSVVVSRNWRVIFRFEDSEACDVDFVDYH